MKFSKAIRLAGPLLAGTSFLVFAGSASAQVAADAAATSRSTQPDTANPQEPGRNDAAKAASSSPNAIVVTGIRASLRNALQTKRNTEVISDNISSQQIGQLPDVTIAEELNRLPGVNTTRDRGNSSQASLRGLGPRFVFGLVNGREVASSEPSQDLRWEEFPSEVLSGVQVYKAQEAAIVPGGIAATIDIRTIRPLDYKGPAVSIRFGPTYNENGENLPNYSPWGYRGSAGLITHLTDNFAIALAASIQREKNAFPDFRTWGWNTTDTGSPGDLNGDGKPDNTTWGLNTEVKNVVQTRKAFVANAGWRPSDNLTINLDSLFSQYTIRENQFQTWYANNILGNWADGDSYIYNAPGGSYSIVNGTVTSLNIPNTCATYGPGTWCEPNYQSVIARYQERHTLLTLGANVDWHQGPWDVTLDLSHSEAKRDNQWRAIYLGDQYGTGLAYNLLGKPSATIDYTGTAPWDPSIQYVSPARPGNNAGPEHTRDYLSAATLDGRYDINGSFLKSVQVGGRISDRVKRHRSYNYYLCAGGSSTPNNDCSADTAAHNIDISQYVYDYTIPQFTAPTMVWGDWDKLWPLVYPNSGIPAGAEQMTARTRVTEKTLEGYAMLNIDTLMGTMPLTGNIGVRVEHVSTRSDGFAQTGSTFLPITAHNNYTNVLPSLNLTAHLTQNQLLRFGAGLAVARPPLDVLTAGVTLNAIQPNQPATGSGGNPYLKPFKAKQIDLSYENYFHEESLFAVAPYYKHLDTFVGSGMQLETFNGIQYQIGTTANSKGGDVWGVETTFQTRFFFLPGLLKNFGIYANYAYAASNIHEISPASHPYKMVGLAKHTAEFDAYYDKGRFEARVAFKYHSPFTVAPTWNGLNLKQLAAEKILDASVSYQLTKNIGLRFQAHNLTNERTRFTTDNNTSDLANDGGYQVYGRSYLADVSFKF